MAGCWNFIIAVLFGRTASAGRFPRKPGLVEAFQSRTFLFESFQNLSEVELVQQAGDHAWSAAQFQFGIAPVR